MAQGINFALAASVGAAAARPGPEITREEGLHLVSDLRNQARRAVGYVAEITGLCAAARRAAAGEIFVTDRRGFARGFVAMAQGLAAEAWADDEIGWFSGQAVGAQLGGVAGVLAQRMLGIYDPFYQARGEGAPGRVLLVAPNILRFERELDSDPRDFHLWIALHELAHVVQFAAAPWLAGWVRDRFKELVDADPDEGRVGRLADAARRLPDLFTDTPPPDSVAAGLLAPSQAAVFAQITGAMSFLEGHADVIMDAVGPRVVKSIEQLRPRFDARRLARGRLERAARRLAGLEAKTAQYVQGASFVRAVLAASGHEGLNRAFTGPEALPSAAEMEDPPAWVARVLG
ncbi:MAG: zinc-dependent metalloprotease [Bifidobacteriaceae bacterium]|nr:zinc-dependent metalloprotease [Bifidobacteriaceae bacterium]